MGPPGRRPTPAQKLALAPQTVLCYWHHRQCIECSEAAIDNTPFIRSSSRPPAATGPAAGGKSQRPSRRRHVARIFMGPGSGATPGPLGDRPVTSSRCCPQLSTVSSLPMCSNDCAWPAQAAEAVEATTISAQKPSHASVTSRVAERKWLVEPRVKTKKQTRIYCSLSVVPPLGYCKSLASWPQWYLDKWDG